MAKRYSRQYHWTYLGVFAATALAIWWAYLPGLNGGFYFDDIRNIYQNLTLRITDIDWGMFADFSTGPSGNRPVSLFSFALHYYLGFTEPWHFRVVNIVIHVLTAGLIAIVVRRIVLLSGWSANRALWCSLGVMVIWALHPIQVTAVTYVVQRMTSLATLFFWAAFYFYLVARTAAGQSTGSRVLVFGGSVAAIFCFSLGVLSKSHVAILPFMVIATEFLIFRSHDNLDWRQLSIVTVGLAAAVMILFVFRSDEMLTFLRQLTVDLRQPIAESRGGTPYHRLISEPRVLFLYLSLFLVPLWSRFSLFWSFEPSQGFLTPLQTLLAILGIIALVWLAYRCRRSHALVAWGITCFLLGHVIEGTVLPLYLVFEHRMYLPSVFLLVAVAALLPLLPAKLPWSIVRSQWLGAVLLIFATVAVAASTHQRNEVWANARTMFVHEIAHNPDNEQLQVNYAMHQLSGEAGFDADEALAYAGTVVEQIKSKEITEERKIRLKRLNSNIALHYEVTRRDLDRAFDYTLEAARYGHTTRNFARLASFYFFAKINAREDMLARLTAEGYDDDESMLRFLEQAYDSGLRDWSVTASLVNTYLYLLKQGGPSGYEARARKVLAENRDRFANDEGKLAAMKTLERNLANVVRKGD